MNEMNKYRLIIEAAEEDTTRFKPRNVAQVLSKYPEGFADRFHQLIDKAVSNTKYDGQSLRVMAGYVILRDLMDEGIVSQDGMAEMRDTIFQAMEDKGLSVVNQPKGKKRVRDPWFNMKS